MVNAFEYHIHHKRTSLFEKKVAYQRITHEPRMEITSNALLYQMCKPPILTYIGLRMTKLDLSFIPRKGLLAELV